MVIILRCRNHLKMCPLVAKKRIESGGETHQLPHVVCPTRSNETMWSVRIESHGQAMWSKQRTTHHSLLRRCCIVTLLQAIVKAPLKIKIRTQNLIRSKQRKSSSRSFPSCRRKYVSADLGHVEREFAEM